MTQKSINHFDVFNILPKSFFSRPAELVLEDVKLERYSIEEARILFGVSISGPPFAIMKEETKHLRTNFIED